MTDWRSKQAGEAPDHSLWVEEINTNDGTRHQLNGFGTSNTVKSLQIAIATLLKMPQGWKDLSIAFAGRVLADGSSTLASHGVQQGDTVYFTRSVAIPDDPPSYNTKEIVLSTVMFKDLDGRTLTTNNIPISWTIRQLKDKLGREKAMELDDYRFLWGAKQLEDEKTLELYGIGNECTIMMVMRLPGGIMTPPFV